ncbi:hypothetical protein KCTCHS21_47670 [Cohnella abietis]|uniref:Uncharacterized protein n=1 Tax=Cohnella abietis TaxID=2507935 RepID=A0A3T1DBL4_9BACL|nr:hypothetical protein KCTCHS21_47670 [Cohnella abietis]
MVFSAIVAFCDYGGRLASFFPIIVAFCDYEGRLALVFSTFVAVCDYGGRLASIMCYVIVYPQDRRARPAYEPRP